MTMKTTILASIAILWAGPFQGTHVGAGPSSPEPSELLERIRRFDASIDPTNRLSGVLLITQGEDVLAHECFGMADHELGAPTTVSTRYCIASITKEMTRLVAWQLLVEGKITLNTPLSGFVHDFPRGDEITIEHLMRHRAGLPHRVTTGADTWKPMDAKSVTARAGESELIADPGTEYSYSSATYTVLAHVIECVEGASFRDVLAARVFRPADMASSSDLDGRSLLPGRAKSYVPGRDGLLNAPLRDLSYLAGAGSVVSTAEDLLAFHRAYRDGTYHPAAWSSLQGDGPTHWTGASNGFHAFLDHDPDTDLTVVFVGNTFGSAPGQLREALPEILGGAEQIGRARPTEWAGVPRKQLEAYVGHYTSRPGATWEVNLRGDDLMIADAVALPLSSHSFWFQGWAQEFVFEQENEGAPWSLRVGDEVWPRVR